MPTAPRRRSPSRRVVDWFVDASPRQWVRRLAIGAGGGLLLVILLFVIAYFTVSLPDPDLETSTIRASDGSTITDLFKGQSRVDVPLSKVSEVMRQAVVATEDKNFYEHSGLDPVGIARAFVNDVRGGALQGGSTITQQLVKNAYLDSERSLVRKAKEAVLAVKVERQYDKREILERYLNTIYFGRGAYGVERAAQLYFGRPAAELDLPQAALLAGLIRAPESADPSRDPQAAENRRAIVLRAMVREKMISQQRADQAGSTPLGARNREDPDASLSGSTAYFAAMVRQWAVEQFGERTTYAGLRIETTLDPKRQAAAEAAVRSVLDRPEDPDAALVSMADDGAVVAMIGGRDFKRSNVNLATNRVRPQAGSTFKPFVLAAALERNVLVGQRYPGPSKKTIEFAGFKPYEVDNFGGESFGDIDLVEATTRSVNTVYAQLAADVGLRDIAHVAADLGIESEVPVVPAMALGAANVSPYEMLRAYMTFANRGQRITPYFVTRVTNHDGTVLYRSSPERSEVYSEQYADVVNDVLQQVVKRGTGRAASFGRPAAGKTGTTTGNTDAWFVGYTPRLGTAVWMGYQGDTKQPMSNVHGRQVTGGSFPAQIWSRYMKAATQGMDTGQFTPPDPELLQGPPESSTTSSSIDEESTTSTSTSADDGSTTTSEATTTTTSRRETTTTTSSPTTTSTTTGSTTSTTSKGRS